jgi:ABC-2 type transport system ATP-binding protein
MSVQVQHLVKQFGKQQAVSDISFEAKPGEILGFLGPNGAGKSTTMKIITGYLPPSSGTAHVCGINVEEDPLAAKKKVGYLPEHNPLYTDMYVHEYLAFSGSFFGLSGNKLKQRAEELVELTGLTREQNKKISALSKGYRQRVGLATALMHNPEVLILDEPTTGLDPNQIVEIRQLIKNIGKQKTVILSTHIMQEVQAICDRVVIINLGKIVANAPIAELQKQAGSKTNFVVEFEKPMPIDMLRAIAGISEVTMLSEQKFNLQTEADVDIRSAIFQLAQQRNNPLLGLSKEDYNLEKIFRDLTTSASPKA